MTQRNCRRNFVHVLPAWAGGTRKRLLQVRFVKVKFIWVTHDEGMGGSLSRPIMQQASEVNRPYL